MFVSRWDVAVTDKVPDELRNQLGIAIAMRTYKAYRELLASPRWQRSSTPAPGRSGCCGPAPAPRIPQASDMLYVKALAAPYTVNTMPEETLLAFADHGEVGADLPADGGDCEAVLARVRARQASTSTRSRRSCRSEGAEAFVKSWNELIGRIDVKTELKTAS